MWSFSQISYILNDESMCMYTNKIQGSPCTLKIPGFFCNPKLFFHDVFVTWLHLNLEK